MSERTVQVQLQETLFQGYFRVDRYHLCHSLFAGGMSDEISREVFERGHAVAVMLYDPAQDAVVLIEQFRPGAYAAGINPWMIEMVAGIIDAGETPDNVAIRESREEAGCDIQRLERIAFYMPSAGGCSETVALYAAQVDSTNIGGVHGLAGEHEDIRVSVVPTDEAIAMADRGEIQSAMALIALYWLDRHRDSLRQRWLA